MKKITNASKKTVLSTDVRVYSSIFAKGIGLMFRLRKPTFCVLFPFLHPQKVPIHMFFVFFSLDIIWLDGNKRVVAAKTLRPWTLYGPKKPVQYVLELPKGTIKKTRTVKGDTIAFV